MEKETKPEEDKSTHDKNWLKEVALQSWEPELIISGVAIYLSSQLPQLFTDWFSYYSFNISTDSGGTIRMLTRLIYGVFVSSATLLIIAFVVHFAARAFWVGLVGLLSVYPKGIQLDKVPRIGKYYREKLAEKMVSLDEFIIRLDKFASIIFSLCFVFVLLTLGIGFIYFFFFMLFNILSLFVSEEFFLAYQGSIFLVLLSLFMLLAISIGILSSKKWKDNPKTTKLQYKMSVVMANLTFPFIYPLIRYLTLTFQSNVNKKKTKGVTLFIFILFYVILFFSMLGNKTQLLLESRSFYISGSAEHQLNPNYYDNLRDENTINPSISIQSDVIQDSYVRLFIAYPKSLDKDLEKFCPKINVPDSLNKYSKRKLKGEKRLQCFSKYFQVYIGDSLYKNLEYVFWTDYDDGTKGLVTYIPSKNFKEGKNLLTIRKSFKNEEKDNKGKGFLHQIPFWYFKKS